MYALMYDHYLLNKPLLLDSSLITRSVSINLCLTNKLSRQIIGLCERDSAYEFNGIKVDEVVTQPRRVGVVNRWSKGVQVVVQRLDEVCVVVQLLEGIRE